MLQRKTEGHPIRPHMHANGEAACVRRARARAVEEGRIRVSNSDSVGTGFAFRCVIVRVRAGLLVRRGADDYVEISIANVRCQDDVDLLRPRAQLYCGLVDIAVKVRLADISRL